MAEVKDLITDNIDVWTSAIKRKSSSGRGSSKKVELYGVKRLRELILDMAVRGLLVPQDPNDEPASELLKRIDTERVHLENEKKVKKQAKSKPVFSTEAPYLLPNNWTWTRLRALAEISPRNNVDDSAMCSFVSMPSISTKIDGSHSHELRKWATIKKGYTHFANGDIGLAKITPCFQNSKAAIFSALSNSVGAGTTELHIARPYGGIMEPRFILIQLKSPSYLIEGKSRMTGSAGQKRVPKAFFTDWPFPLPPLQEQHRIVAKVDELIALCDQLEQQTEASLTAHQTLVKTLLDALTQSATQQTENEHTAANTPSPFERAWQRLAEHFDTVFTTEDSIDQLKQTILQLAVMGKLVPQDPNDEPASELLKRIADERAKLIADKKLKTKANEKLELHETYISSPKSWSWKRLGNIAKFIDYRGRTPTKTTRGVRLITAKNVRFGYLDTHPEEYISEEEYDSWMTRGFPELGDILFTPEAPLGNVAVVDLEEKFALAQRAICFQLPVSGLSDFLKILIMSSYFQKQLIDNASGMTATGIKASKLKEIPIPIPPLKEQYRIVAKVDELMAICDQLKSNIAQAQASRLQLADTITKQAINH